MALKRKAGDTPTGDSKKTKANASITSFFGAPKAVSTTTKADGTTTEEARLPPAPKFNKEAWVKTLTSDQKDLLKLEIDTLHDSWLKELKDEITSKEFLELKKFLKRELDANKKIFPPMEDVYSWYV